MRRHEPKYAAPFLFGQAPWCDFASVSNFPVKKYLRLPFLPRDPAIEPQGSPYGRIILRLFRVLPPQHTGRSLHSSPSTQADRSIWYDEHWNWSIWYIWSYVPPNGMQRHYLELSSKLLWKQAYNVDFEDTWRLENRPKSLCPTEELVAGGNCLFWLFRVQ